MNRKLMERKFYKTIQEDNIYKMDGHCIITGKGASWNQAKNEIEIIYDSWIEACELLGQGEDEVLSRIEKCEIVKESINYKERYLFVDDRGIIGEPIIVDGAEQKTDILLLLLFISAKMSDGTRKYIRDFAKEEYSVGV